MRMIELLGDQASTLTKLFDIGRSRRHWDRKTVGAKDDRRGETPVRRDLRQTSLELLRPRLNETRMVVPAAAVIDPGRVRALRGARVRDILLIAFPTRLGSERREDNSQCSSHAVGGHPFESLGEEWTGVTHADVDG